MLNHCGHLTGFSAKIFCAFCPGAVILWWALCILLFLCSSTVLACEPYWSKGKRSVLIFGRYKSGCPAEILRNRAEVLCNHFYTCLCLFYRYPNLFCVCYLNKHFSAQCCSRVGLELSARKVLGCFVPHITGCVCFTLLSCGAGRWNPGETEHRFVEAPVSAWESSTQSLGSHFFNNILKQIGAI